MPRTSSFRPTHLVILGSLAVLVCLAGTATAVTKIGTRNLRKGAVATGKLRDDAVTRDKLADGAVTTEHLQDESVTRPKLGAGAVTGSRVQDGSLDLEDIAQVAVNVGYNPATINMNACATSGDIPVPGMQGGEEILVLPGGYDDGWPGDLFLDAYGPSGPGSIRVRVCFYGSPSVNPSSLPLRVLLFR